MDTSTSNATDPNTANTAPVVTDEKSPEANRTPKATAEPVVEEKKEVVYDLKLSDKSALDAASLESTIALAKELNLAPEAAQKTLAYVESQVASKIEATIASHIESHKPGGDAWKAQIESWEQESLADKEIGGTKEQLDKSIATAKRVLGTFGDEGFNAMLHDSGFGSHPAVIRFLSKIGKAVGEDNPIKAPTGTPKDPLEALYPTMAKK